MRQKLQVTQKLKQELRLSPELRQSIEMLRFNLDELGMFLEEIAMENPIMDLEKADDSKSIEEGLEKSEDRRELLELVESFDTFSPSGPTASREEEEFSFLDYSSDDSTLKEDLLFQLSGLELDDEMEAICREVIDHVNSRGYFEGDLDKICQRTGASLEQAEEALKIVQSFEPLGIGARTLAECLCNQLDCDRCIELVENHLEDIAANRMNKIAKDMGLGLPEVLELVDKVRSLNPKPGSSYSVNQPVKYIVPEASIEEEDGELKVVMHDEYVPQVRISPSYKTMIKTGDEETLKYLKEKLESLKWIQSSIAQRESTIKRILDEVVKYQEDFFRKGDKYLKAMSQKEMSEILEVHESTISRASSGKYVNTPQGIKEIGFFFSLEAASAGGEDGANSKVAIQSLIKDIIDGEDKKKPLSDSRIETMLKDRDIKISRRTIANYREELGIPNSTLRRSYQ